VVGSHGSGQRSWWWNKCDLWLVLAEKVRRGWSLEVWKIFWATNLRE